MADISNKWPIEEVLCTIHFNPSEDWDVTVFGKYYSKIEKEYCKKEQFKILKRSLEDDVGISNNGSCEEETLMRFSNNEGNRIVQLSRDTLVMNLRSPYPGWEEFKPEVLNRIDDYVDSFKPERIDSLGIRYINKFSEPAEDFAIGHIFRDNNYVPGVIFEKKSPFMSRLLFMNGNDILTELNTGQIDTDDENQVAIILDIEVSSLKKLEAEREFLSDQLDDFHKRLSGIFKSCISDRLRKKYGLAEE